MGHNDYEVNYLYEWNTKYFDDNRVLCGEKYKLCKISNMSKKRVCLYQLCVAQLMFVLGTINTCVNNHCTVNTIIL